MMTIPSTAQKIITAVNAAGFECYAVGGSVRDSLMQKPTKGWDFTTSASPEEILQIFPDSFYDNRFGTVGIKIYENGKKLGDTGEEMKPIDIFEITTYRSETGYTDKRHPDTIIWGKTLTEDLSRRDFTINAIATDGINVIDPYGGQKDLESKLIRTVGNPDERFGEDALRMMRAVRIATQISFLIEDKTRQAIIDNVHLLRDISAERVRDELLKILASDFPSDGVLLLKNTGILKLVIPELDDAFSVDQKSPNRHHRFDVGTHSTEALKFCQSTDEIVRLATLLHDIGKTKTVRKLDDGTITFYNHEVIGARMVKSIASRLRLSKKQIDKLYTLVRWHQFSVDERQTDSAIRRIIRRVTPEYMEDMLSLRIGDRLGGGALETSWRLELFKKRLFDVQQQPFSVSDLKVNGYDVMNELSLKPGPLIGKILNTLFSEVEQNTLPNERETLIKRMKDIATSLND